MDRIENLNNLHFDVLKEIGSIGAGNAVTSLSTMLNKRIEMSVPQVKLLDFKEIADFIGGPENIVIGILVNISGEINGIMMFLVQYDSAKTLIDIVMGDMGMKASDQFTEMELSAMTEIGNILAGSYLGSLAGFINKKIRPSIPYLSIDMANAILSVPAIEFGKISDKVIFIESLFGTDSDNVSGYFILVPDMPSFKIILSSLGVM